MTVAKDQKIAISFTVPPQVFQTFPEDLKRKVLLDDWKIRADKASEKGEMPPDLPPGFFLKEGSTQITPLTEDPDGPCTVSFEIGYDGEK